MRIKEWRARRRTTKAAQKASGAAQEMGTEEVRDWAQACLYGVGRSLSEVTKGHPDSDFLMDNAIGEAEVLLVLLEELKRRRQEGFHLPETPPSGLY